MDIQLEVPQGEFEILRYPKRQGDLLRAWDAADEYLLEYIAEELNLESHSKILIINDGFGALSVALNKFDPHNSSDSFISQQATRLNLAANDISDNKITFINSLETSEETFDLILIKIPKTLALLEDQLTRIQGSISQNTIVIAAGMIKNLPKKAWHLLEKLIGPTTTSRAKKKARLIFVTQNPERQVPPCPYPVYYQLENTEYQICNHANVFSRDSLDIGTRFLIENLPQATEYNEIIDLGCGSGVVGLMLAKTHPDAMIHFVDESYMAVASARETFSSTFSDQKNAAFYVSDTLTDFDPNSVNLIVCNPPFHQQHAKADQMALRMFKQSKKVLCKNGELWVVGNRHLNYHQKLKSLFGNSTIVAANSKFVISKACVEP